MKFDQNTQAAASTSDDREKILKLERDVKLLKQALSQSDRVRKQWLSSINELKKTRHALMHSEKILREVLDTIPVAVFWKDSDLKYIGCNNQFLEDNGLSMDDVLGKISPVENWQRIDKEILKTGQAIHDREELRERPDGSAFWVNFSRIPLKDENGETIGLLGCYENINSRKQIELELQSSQALLEEKVRARTQELVDANAALAQEIEERKQVNSTLKKFSSAVEKSGSVVVITDRTGTIQYVNPQFIATTGYSAEEAMGKTPRILKSGETPMSVYRELWQTILSGNHWHGELHNRRKSGEYYWSYLSISPIADDSDEITHFVAVSEDVTELKSAQHEMEKLALFDALTSLPNRRLFRDRLEKALEYNQRAQKKLAIIFIDLDNFKQINDTLGHDCGDRLLITVSRRLRSELRLEDTVARLGGDEFTVLLSDLHSTADVRLVSQKLLSAIRRPIIIDGHEINVTCSLGITIAPNDSGDAGILMKNADLAMYKAKESGRNTLRFFTESMDREISNRVKMEKELKLALQEKQFELYFQPQINLATGKIIGCEALLRWNHPTKGLTFPGEFISVAEDSGIIILIGEWVINEACRVAKQINQDRSDPIRVSVNLSAHQFQDPTLPSKVSQIIEEVGVNSQLLELEITETVLMTDTKLASSLLDGLKDLGVSLAIDDFGTGYSSLSYLKRFPVDTLKIDRSFVMDIPRDSNDMAITAAVLAMAKQLRLSVIAEGIETERQLAFLHEHACEGGQGYLFSRPVPIDQFEAYLKENADTQS